MTGPALFEAPVSTRKASRRRLAREQRILARFAQLPFNYDAPGDPEQARSEGWKVDSHRQVLESEIPGEPVSGGPWETAGQLARDYEFVDPSIIRAVWAADATLDGRTMALRGRFTVLHFWLGVRVTSVSDGMRSEDGRAARVFSYGYQTLADHLETGELFYEVWKWVDTGQVEWRIRSLSRRARIRNPIVDLGFRIFGRRTQLRFVRTANANMARLVAERANRVTTAPRPATPS